MTLVRCPGCSATFEDPASEFRCASCGRRAVRTPSHGLDLGGRSQSLARSHQDVLAAATEIFHDQHAPAAAVERAGALLTGQSAADLREAALGAAWMLATTLRTIETTSPGVGLEILQALGLALVKVEEAR